MREIELKMQGGSCTRGGGVIAGFYGTCRPEFSIVQPPLSGPLFPHAATPESDKLNVQIIEVPTFLTWFTIPVYDHGQQCSDEVTHDQFDQAKACRARSSSLTCSHTHKKHLSCLLRMHGNIFSDVQPVRIIENKIRRIEVATVLVINIRP